MPLTLLTGASMKKYLTFGIGLLVGVILSPIIIKLFFYLVQGVQFITGLI
jgi:hypothetical protein